jgi:AcrR family transcriptional regulator
MAKRAPRPRPKRPAKRRATYHHGNLREALLEAAEQMVEEQGPETITVREAARRAGVSPGAPFRHFASRTALMTGVAERAMGRFLDEIDRGQAEVSPGDAPARYAALGRSYLRWAMRHPAQFRVLATRSLIDFDSSDSLTRDNESIRALMQSIVADGQRRGQIRAADPGALELLAKALSYGLARMYVDGHFPQWGVAEADAERAMHRVLDLFLELLRADPAPGAGDAPPYLDAAD